MNASSFFFDIFRISFVYLKILGLLILWKCIKIHQMWVLNNQFYFNLSAFRGHQARKTYKPVIEKRHEAAVKIQSVVRGHRTRQELKQKRIEEEKVAMLLQEGKLLRTEKKKKTCFTCTCIIRYGFIRQYQSFLWAELPWSFVKRRVIFPPICVTFVVM